MQVKRFEIELVIKIEIYEFLKNTETFGVYFI